MLKAKKMTSKSGLTIPKDMRAETGFFPGMAVDLETHPDGILLRPHVPVCRFCGSPEGNGAVMGMSTCGGCRGKLRKELERFGDN